MSYETGINIAITKLANDLDLTTLDKQELLSYIESLESKLDFICDSCGIVIDEIEVEKNVNTNDYSWCYYVSRL